MEARRWSSAALLAGLLLVGGCGQDTEMEAEEETIEEGLVPPGAIPAAPDVRPGTEATEGGVIQTGAATDSVTGLPAEPAPADTIGNE